MKTVGNPILLNKHKLIDDVRLNLGAKVTCISKKNANPVAITFEMKMSKVC